MAVTPGARGEVGQGHAEDRPSRGEQSRRGRRRRREEGQQGAQRRGPGFPMGKPMENNLQMVGFPQLC